MTIEDAIKLLKTYKNQKEQIEINWKRKEITEKEEAKLEEERKDSWPTDY